MALIEERLVDLVTLHPEQKTVDVRWVTRIIDDVTQEVRARDYFRRAFHVSEVQGLRDALGAEKADLLIANL